MKKLVLIIYILCLNKIYSQNQDYIIQPHPDVKGKYIVIFKNIEKNKKDTISLITANFFKIIGDSLYVFYDGYSQTEKCFTLLLAKHSLKNGMYDYKNDVKFNICFDSEVYLNFGNNKKYNDENKYKNTSDLISSCKIKYKKTQLIFAAKNKKIKVNYNLPELNNFNYFLKNKFMQFFDEKQYWYRINIDPQKEYLKNSGLDKIVK